MNRLAHNIAYNLAGQCLLALLRLLAIKYVLRDLGSDAFGLFVFVHVMNATLATALERGIASTTTREVASRPGADPALRQLLRTASLFYWGAFVLLAAAIVAAAPYLVRHWFTLVTLPAADGIYVLRVLAVASLLELPRSFYASLFRGQQRMDLTNALDVGGLLLQQAGILVLLAIDASLIQVVYWMGCSFAASTAMAAWLAVRRFPAGSLVPAYHGDALRAHRAFAGRMSAVSLTAMVNAQVDKAVLSKYLPIGIVGYYGFAFGVVSSLKALAGASALAAFPSFAGRASVSQRPALVSQYRKLQDVNAVVNFVVFAAFAALQYQVFAYFLNAEAARLLFVPTLLLCAGSYMNSIANIPYTLSVALGAPAIALRGTVYAFLFLTPLTIALTARWGVLGAATGWMTFNVFVLFYTVPRVCRECLGIPVWNAYAPVLKVCLLGGAIGGAGWAIWNAWGGSAVGPALIVLSISIALFLIASYWLIFDRDLRRALLVQAGLQKPSHEPC